MELWQDSTEWRNHYFIWVNIKYQTDLLLTAQLAAFFNEIDKDNNEEFKVTFLRLIVDIQIQWSPQ
jgi:hypothetical protein